MITAAGAAKRARGVFDWLLRAAAAQAAIYMVVPVPCLISGWICAMSGTISIQESDAARGTPRGVGSQSLQGLGCQSRRYRQKLALREPFVYAIHIQGILDESCGDYFGGQIVSTKDKADRLPMSTLRTPPMDQALVGLISRLHGLVLLLLSVEHVCAESKES